MICATIILFLPKILNIYFVTLEKGNPLWFGIGETKGPCMLAKHKVPRIGSDYGKAKQLLIATNDKYIMQRRWEGVSTRDDLDIHHDDIIHNWLETIPGIRRLGKESFEIFATSSLTQDIIEDMIQKKFFSKQIVEKPRLELRKHQKEFLIKINSNWEKWKEFLLFAKCRSGKSIMALSHVVQKGYKVTLVVSRYTSPIQSWRNDVEKFADFDNLVFINIKDKNWKEQLTYWLNIDKQIILWSTIQSTNRLKEIPCSINFIIYDEAHIGYGKTQWKSLCEKYDCPTLYVTGTAYDIEENFSNNKFVYSYFEEQRDKKLGLNNEPSMELVLVKYNLNEEYKKLYGDDPDAIKNTFSLNDDKTDFREPALVRGFYSEHFGHQRHLRVDKRLLKNAKHIYMCLPSIQACHLAVKYLKGTDFAPLVVTGDTKEDSDSIKKHIAENPQGTIILTVRANVLGVTIEELDTVINCAEGDSKNFYFQFAFRGGSSKKNWTVIDFCPRRCLQTLREIYLSSCDNDPSISEYEFSEYFAAILEYSDGYTVMSQERLAEILSSNDVENSRRIMSRVAYSMDFDKLEDFVMNLDLTPSNYKNSKSEVISSADVNGKSNKTKINPNYKNQDFNVNLNKKIKTVDAILERIPLVLFHMIRKGEIPNSIYHVISSDHYVNDTLDNEKVLKSLLNEKIINERSLNCRMIQVATDIQHQIIKDECGTLEGLSCSRQSQKSIPVELMNQLLDGIF